MGAAVVLSWIWYDFFYQSLQAQENLKIAEINNLEQKKLLIPDLRYRVDVLKRHTDQIRQELQFHLLNKESVDPYVTLEHVLLAIDAIGLRLISLSPQEFKHKAFYEKCSFGFKVLGSYEQVMQLFSRFCEKHARSVFKQVDLITQGEQLLLNAVIAVYVIDKDGL